MAKDGRVFQLMSIFPSPTGQPKSQVGSVVLPYLTSLEKVVAAWSYAVCYSADGLDRPNYDKALSLLQQRHPSWLVLPGVSLIANYDRDFVDYDGLEA